MPRVQQGDSGRDGPHRDGAEGCTGSAAPLAPCLLATTQPLTPNTQNASCIISNDVPVTAATSNRTARPRSSRVLR